MRTVHSVFWPVVVVFALLAGGIFFWTTIRAGDAQTITPVLVISVESTTGEAIEGACFFIDTSGDPKGSGLGVCDNQMGETMFPIPLPDLDSSPGVLRVHLTADDYVIWEASAIPGYIAVEDGIPVTRADFSSAGDLNTAVNVSFIYERPTLVGELDVDMPMLESRIAVLERMVAQQQEPIDAMAVQMQETIDVMAAPSVQSFPPPLEMGTDITQLGGVNYIVNIPPDKHVTLLCSRYSESMGTMFFDCGWSPEHFNLPITLQ